VRAPDEGILCRLAVDFQFSLQRILCFETNGLRRILRVSWTAKKRTERVLNKAGVGLSLEGTVRHCQSKEASILWSHHEETRELPGERDNAMNNARR